MKIKICGITNIADAEKAVEFGADLLGFIFYKGSDRYIDPLSARNIIEKLPSDIKKVGVFVNEEIENLKNIKERAKFDLFQIHGDETPEYCNSIGECYIKAVRVKSEDDIKQLNRYNTDLFLFDGYSEDAYGGTGKLFEWELLRNSALSGKFVILSGGLNAENVGAAIKTVKPNVVDVSSGVEEEPGKKDIGKMRKFIEVVRDVAEI